MIKHVITNYEDPNDELAGICLSSLPPRRFIEIQTDAIVYESKEYTYYPFGLQKYLNDFCKLHNLPPTYKFTSKDIDLITIDFNRIIKIVVPLSVHLEEYSVQTGYPTYKKRKSMIFILFLICWSYILFVSYNPMLFEQYTILSDIVNNEEPFSGLVLIYEFTSNETLQNIFKFLSKFLPSINTFSCLWNIVDNEEPFSGIDI
jgi:hypothetical protein